MVVREAVAAKYGSKMDSVFVIEIATGTGLQHSTCSVEVYDDPETAKRIVPKHIQIRNMPPEERKKVKEETKKTEEKPKAETKTKAKPETKPESKEAKGETEAKEAAKPKPEAKAAEPAKAKEGKTK